MKCKFSYDLFYILNFVYNYVYIKSISVKMYIELITLFNNISIYFKIFI